MEKIKELAEHIADILKDCRFNDITDSSGYFVIKEFNDGTDRAVDVHKSNIDGKPHYVVYCSFEDEQSDWRYTENLSTQELFKVIEELCNEE